jgi:hypothetical protein
LVCTYTSRICLFAVWDWLWLGSEFEQKFTLGASLQFC